MLAKCGGHGQGFLRPGAAMKVAVAGVLRFWETPPPRKFGNYLWK